MKDISFFTPNFLNDETNDTVKEANKAILTYYNVVGKIKKEGESRNENNSIDLTSDDEFESYQHNEYGDDNVDNGL